MKRPSHLNKQTPHERLLSPRVNKGLFAIGNPSISSEVKFEGSRILVWERKESDSYFAEIAGWSNLQIDPTNLNLGSVGAIRIPRGARTANTLLAGYEAWVGEKASALGYIADYTKRVQDIFGLGNIDTSVTLNSLALTREGEFFITPPHKLEYDKEKIEIWKSSLMNEVDIALQNTVTFQAPESLIDQFQSQLNSVIQKNPS